MKPKTVSLYGKAIQPSQRLFCVSPDSKSSGSMTSLRQFWHYMIQRLMFQVHLKLSAAVKPEARQEPQFLAAGLAYRIQAQPQNWLNDL